MKAYTRKIESLNAVLHKDNSPSKNILMGSRLYLAYFITEDNNYLNNALNSLILCFNNNPSSTELYFFIIFLYIEKNDIEKAEYYINNVNSNRNYLKNNEQENYIKFMFLKTYLELKKGNERHLKKFKKIFKNEIYEVYSHQSYTFLGFLNFEIQNYEEAMSNFIQSFGLKNNQWFLNICLIKFFNISNSIFDKDIFHNIINWALAQDIDIINILTDFQEFIIKNSDRDVKFYKRLYAKYPLNYILNIICKKLMLEKDMSLESFNYFKEAERKQMLDSSYNSHYINLAYFNDIENISRYILIEYLNSNSIDANIKSYLYYHLIKDTKLKDILDKHRTKIMQFAIIGIENKVTTKYFLNIYACFIAHSKQYKINEELIKFAENQVSKELFSYTVRVKSPVIKYLWVSDSLKKDIESYVVKDYKVKIQSSTKNFSVFCFDMSIKNIINDEIEIQKIIEYDTIELYKYFYNKGYRSQNLLLSVSNYYISTDNIYVDGLKVLKETLETDNISKNVRVKINATIGNIYNNNSRYEEALQYYLSIDRKNLNDKYVEPMVTVFLNAGEIEKAVDLIVNKPECMSDKNLFFAIKEIYRYEDYNYLLANCSYELLLKLWYDKILIDIVINNFKGGLAKWKQLSRVVLEVSEDLEKIDNRVLENSLFVKVIDNDIEKVFLRSYERNSDSELVKQFIYFLTYEILCNEKKLEYDTINILEKEYTKTENKILSYALSQIYISNGIVTNKSVKTLKEAQKFMQLDEILFPIFKKLKDKNITASYIEKNQPFIYKTYPGRKVYIYYKFDNDEDFSKKQMKYFNFGMYMVNIIWFYGERITYYISEELDTGSMETKVETLDNSQIITGNDFDDYYFTINQALIYQKSFKFNEVAHIIGKELRSPKKIKGRLI